MTHSSFETSDSGSWPRQQGQLFEARFANWLRIRSSLIALDREPLSHQEFETKHLELSQNLDDAARLAITTHVHLGRLVWKKFEILDATDFEVIDRRQIWMLAAIKADLAALGIKDSGDSL